MAMQFLAKAVGAEVFAISHSPNKKEEAMQLVQQLQRKLVGAQVRCTSPPLLKCLVWERLHCHLAGLHRIALRRE